MGNKDGASLAFSELRKESQDLYNRIHSIAEDADFVDQVYQSYPRLPLIPNMRCGAWYTDPDTASNERAYFKSTDGHTGNWSFNLRRPNLHVLPLICAHAGLLLVDSTRAGKRMPDALSKTVPIWCAVMNRAVLKTAPNINVDADAWNTKLYTPPGVVSAQEHDQIEQKLDGWADDLAASFYVLPKLQHPLRPIWITPSTTIFPKFPKTDAERRFYPIICISASKQVLDGMERRVTGFSYIQGSGDDHELWSMGLTPTQFWKHKQTLLNANRNELPTLVQALTSSSNTQSTHTNSNSSFHPTSIHHIHGRLSICTTDDIPSSLNDEFAAVYLTNADQAPPALKDHPHVLYIQTPRGKKGQHHFLHSVLPQTMPFILHHLQNTRRICIACETGTDTSIGVALAALTKFFDNSGKFCDEHEYEREGVLSKDNIKTRLHWIITSCPQANPSRTTLKRVNEFLLSPPEFLISPPKLLPPSGVPTSSRERETISIPETMP
ncbi:initiator tRNA phosphoribosyl transferase [Suillus subaureus]|uniref:Initiator tRNA phosphoribosyl transferase n=1 Tax=Suillus subaureus TaxID=48587 RepID=A0A9P7ELD2_9AGAM|nr:initiator tRNA phosphoribosyl transferase [Suillus subaureus]KAG1824375.1 initiator tRNA phosphoribosyl transferase [Suillus subaureus]